MIWVSRTRCASAARSKGGITWLISASGSRGITYSGVRMLVTLLRDAMPKEYCVYPAYMAIIIFDGVTCELI